ncbi:unnamed protein product [Amoebophrya sp. A120]|nr:unnamed protein product [Amoebophrya sp. A120]|eukprot:GSA120T00006489001.1
MQHLLAAGSGSTSWSNFGSGTTAVVPEVSPTLINVISLTFQYFLVYAAYHILRTYNQLRKGAIETNPSGNEPDNDIDVTIDGNGAPITASTRAPPSSERGRPLIQSQTGRGSAPMSTRDQATTTLKSTRWPDALELEQVLQKMVQTVQLAPMLAVLFIATRLRASTLGDNQSPPGYAQTCMYVATYAVLTDTIVAAVLPFFISDVSKAESGMAANDPVGGAPTAAGDPEAPPAPPANTWLQRLKDRVEDAVESATGYDIDGDGDVGESDDDEDVGATKFFGAAVPSVGKRKRLTRHEKRQQAYQRKLVAMRAVKILSITRTALTFAVYASFSVVIFALIAMEAPAGNRHCPTCAWSWTPDVPASLQCLINLTLQYFAVYLALYASQMYSIFCTPDRQPTKVAKFLERAREASELCPILAVLFIAVRLRANQLKTEPQEYAKTAFYVTTYAVLGQTVLALLQPLVHQLNTLLGFLLECAKYLFLLSIYAGTVVVIYSIFDLELPKHFGSSTPALSTPGKCILLVVMVYFVVFILLQMIRSYSLWVLKLHAKTNLEIMLEESLPSLELIPMLGVVFVAARFRAMEVRPNQGGEIQQWAKIFMYLAACAVLVQTAVSIVLPYFNGQIQVLPVADPAAPVKERILLNYRRHTRRETAKSLSMAKFAAMAGVYAGVAGVLVSILTIEPTSVLL